MNDDSEPERMDSLFQEMNALEKQFQSLLERQTPYAADVTNIIQRLFFRLLLYQTDT
jgi:hypothetical protein